MVAIGRIVVYCLHYHDSQPYSINNVYGNRKQFGLYLYCYNEYSSRRAADGESFYDGVCKMLE